MAVPPRADELAKGAQRQLLRHPSGVECFEASWRGHRTRHHAHPEYQLTLTLAGVGRFSYRGGQARIPEHCLALFHPDQPHLLEGGTRAEGWHMRSLHLPRHLVEHARIPLHQPAPFVGGPPLLRAFDAVWNAVSHLRGEHALVTAAHGLADLLCKLPG